MMYRTLNSVKRFRSYELFFFFGAIPHHERRRTGNADTTEVDGKRIMASFLHRSPIGEKEKGGTEEQPSSRGEYRSSLKDRIRQKTFLLSHILDYRVLVSFFFLFFLFYMNRMMFFDEK